MSVYSKMQDPVWKASAESRKKNSLGTAWSRGRKKRTKLTPEQISKLSKRQQELKEQTHMHCPMEVRKKGPHIGLYCACHGTWIKWINQREARTIQDIL